MEVGPTASSFGSFGACFDGMQFLARFEAHRLAGRNADLGAGPRIAADAGFASAYAEDAKPAQLDAFARGQSLFEALEDGVYGCLSLCAGQARTLNHMMDDVLLDQWGNLAGATSLTLLRPMRVMLQVLLRL